MFPRHPGPLDRHRGEQLRAESEALKRQALRLQTEQVRGLGADGLGVPAWCSGKGGSIYIYTPIYIYIDILYR